MNGTFFASGLLQSAYGFMVSGLIGMLFGIFLEQAGFGSSRRLAGVFYLKDMTVIKVMMTAVLVALVGYHYLVAFGWLVPGQIYMLETFWLAQIIGGLIFGAGFVIGGWCPGTALVGLASAKLDALVFLVGVILGSIFFSEVFPLIRPVYEGLPGGTLFLYETLGMSAKELIFGISLVAIALFVACSRIERNVWNLPKPSLRSMKGRAVAAGILVLLSAGLFYVPRWPMEAKAVRVFRSGYLEEIARAEDHIEAMALSRLIMEEGEKLTVIDLRSPNEYAQFHLRGAVNIPLETLPERVENDVPREGLVVFYSNGTTHAAQAWLQMRHWGWSNTRVLMDGLLGFWRECLTPPSLQGVTDEASAKEQFGAFRARRDYFLGEENR